jgi:flagellar biosynthesis component FlhA
MHAHAARAADLPAIDVVPIRRVLVSLFDKAGIDRLAAGLKVAGVHVVSTGGTKAALASQGLEVEDIVLEPGLAERLQRSIAEAAQRQEAQGKSAVLLVPGPLRAVLARFLRHTHRAMKVISYQEVPESRQVTIEATVG